MTKAGINAVALHLVVLIIVAVLIPIWLLLWFVVGTVLGTLRRSQAPISPERNPWMAASVAAGIGLLLADDARDLLWPLALLGHI